MTQGSFSKYIYSTIEHVFSSFVDGKVFVVKNITATDLKGNYAYGDDLEIEVRVNYTNGLSRVLSADEYTVEGFDSTHGQMQTVTVRYQEYGETYECSVRVTVVTVTGLNVQTIKKLYQMDDNETFQKEDLKVTALYSNGTTKTLKENEYTVTFDPGPDNNNNKFNVFGEKTGVVAYTHDGVTVDKSFTVVAVNTTLLELEGAGDAVNPGQMVIERYFEQFGINAVGQQFYHAPGNSGDVVLDELGKEYNLEFATGTVTYTANLHAGEASYDDTDKNGQITINCTSAPFADIFGYIGYKDRVPIAFGVYVDDVENLQYTAPLPSTPEVDEITNTTNARYFYIQAPLNNMNLSVGRHEVVFVSVFDDGIQELTRWVVNIEREEVDIANKTANVIVLAGQSNAYGAALLSDDYKKFMSGADYSNIFINYSNINCVDGQWKPLFANSEFNTYSPGLGGAENGLFFGPELGMAYYLANTASTKDEVWYIIKFTAAGTILNGQWLSNVEGAWDNDGLVEDMGASLSELMFNFIDASLEDIREIHGDNINFHSFLWVQGESDALLDSLADRYQENEKRLVQMLRDEYADYAKDGDGNNIAFVTSAIAKYDSNYNQWTFSDKVNTGKLNNSQVWYVPEDSARNVSVEGVDLTESQVAFNPTSGYLHNSAWLATGSLQSYKEVTQDPNADGAHYVSDSMYKLGFWLAVSADYINTVYVQNQ